MKHVVTVSAIVATFALALPSSANSFFSSRNGARVLPLNSAVFEVVPRTAGRTNDIWCAAADYAQRGVGASWKSRIYVVRGRGPSETTGRRTAVQFTLDPQAAGVTPIEGGFFTTGFSVGDSMSVSQANGFCEPVPIRF